MVRDGNSLSSDSEVRGVWLGKEWSTGSVDSKTTRLFINVHIP